MNKLLLITLFSCLLTTEYSTAQQLTYSKVIQSFSASTLTPSFDGGYMMADENGVVVKVDFEGDVVWAKYYDNGNPQVFPDVFFNHMQQTFDSCFVLAGSAYNDGIGYADALCMKINQLGDTVWSTAIRKDGFASFIALAAEQVTDSGYVITGNASDPNFSSTGIFAAKLNGEGTVEWITTISGVNNSFYSYTVKQLPDSAYIIGGYAENYPPFEPNAFLLKLSAAGDLVWSKKYNYPEPGFTLVNDIAVTATGLICYLNNNSDIAFIKTDFLGNVEWSKTYGNFCGNQGMIPNSTPKLHKTADNNYVFASGSDYCGRLAKIDTAGNLFFGRDLFQTSIDVTVTTDTGYFIAGTGPWLGVQQIPDDDPLPRSLGGNFYQTGIIKTDSLGFAEQCVNDMFLSSTTDNMTGTDANFIGISGGTSNFIHPNYTVHATTQHTGCIDFSGSLAENNPDKLLVYPNPASGYVTITTLIDKGFYTLTDITGKTVMQGTVSTEKFTLNISALSNGIYFITLFNTNKQARGIVVKS